MGMVINAGVYRVLVGQPVGNNITDNIKMDVKGIC
jgi:hypothetical protein